MSTEVLLELGYVIYWLISRLALAIFFIVGVWAVINFIRDLKGGD